MAGPAAWIETGIGAAVLALEAAAALVILLAGGRALLAFLSRVLHHKPTREEERRRFARALLLALDFTIGSDVLKIAIRPTLDSVLLIGLVVLVRAVLTLVLEFELRRSREGPEAETSTARGSLAHARG